MQHRGRAGAVFPVGADLCGRWRHCGRGPLPVRGGDRIPAGDPGEKGVLRRLAGSELYPSDCQSNTLEAEYTPYTSALTDGGELPEILMDGSFSSWAEVFHTTENVTWTYDRGQSNTTTVYTVTVDDPDLEQVSYTVHYRLPDSGKRCALWVQDERGWSQGGFRD